VPQDLKLPIHSRQAFLPEHIDSYIEIYKEVFKTGRDKTVETELLCDGEMKYVRSTISSVGVSKEFGLPLFIHWNEDITGTYNHKSES
jgi:hypothetical protein